MYANRFGIAFDHYPNCDMVNSKMELSLRCTFHIPFTQMWSVLFSVPYYYTILLYLLQGDIHYFCQHIFSEYGPVAG